MEQADDKVSNLEFAKIWHRVFVRHLEYVVLNLEVDPHLDSAKVSDVDGCQLGKWLSLQAEALDGVPEYYAVLKSHAVFHECASNVAKAYLTGDKRAVNDLLSGTYTTNSKALEKAIDDLSLALQAGGHVVAHFLRDEHEADEMLDESFSVGIDEVDREHHMIVMLINEIVRHGHLGLHSEEGQDFLSSLMKYFINDFEAEERIMMQVLNDSEQQGHKRAHDDLLAYVADLNCRVMAGEDIPLRDVGRQLSDWYGSHFASWDLALSSTMH